MRLEFNVLSVRISKIGDSPAICFDLKEPFLGSKMIMISKNVIEDNDGLDISSNEDHQVIVKVFANKVIEYGEKLLIELEQLPL